MYMKPDIQIKDEEFNVQTKDEEPDVQIKDEEFDWDVERALGECYAGRKNMCSNGVFYQGLSSLGLPVSGSRNHPIPLSSAALFGPPQAAISVLSTCHLERRIWGYDPRQKGTHVTVREINAKRQHNDQGSDVVLSFNFQGLSHEVRLMILSECVRSARLCPRCNITHKMKVTTLNGMRLWGIGPMPIIFCVDKGIYGELVKMIYKQVSEARITGHSVRHQYIWGKPFDIREVHPNVGQYVTNVRIVLKHEYPLPSGNHWVDSDQERPSPMLALANHLEHYQSLKTVHLRIELLSYKVLSCAFEGLRAFDRPKFVFQLELAPTKFSKKKSTIAAAKKISKTLARDVEEQWDVADYDRPVILSPFVNEPEKKKEILERSKGRKSITLSAEYVGTSDDS